MPDDSELKKSKMPRQLSSVFRKVEVEDREWLEQEIIEENFDQIDEDEPRTVLFLVSLVLHTV